MADKWASTDDHAPTAVQWASTEDHSPAKDVVPSQSSEYGKGLYDSTIGGLVSTAKAIVPTAPTKSVMEDVKTDIGAGHYFEAAKKAARASVEALPGGHVVTGLIDTSIDQARKAHEDYTRGNLPNAVLHAGAAVVPFAAGGVDAALGSEAKYDKYGNVIQDAVSPNSAKALGNATGLAASVVAPKVITKIAGKIIPKGEVQITPALKSSLTPEEAAVVQYADEKGIPIPASVRTGNKALAHVESYLANAPGSSGVMKSASEATRAALEKTGTDLVEAGAGSTTYPTVSSPEIAGETFQAGQAARNLAIQEGARQAQAAMDAQGAGLANKTAPNATTVEGAGAGVASELKSVADTHATGARNAYTRLRDAEALPENIKEVPIGPGKIPDAVMKELDAVSTSLAGKPFDALTDTQKAQVTETAKKLGIDATPQPETAKMAFPVEMKAAKAKLAPILDHLMQEPADVLNRSRALPAIKAIVNGPDHVPASVAEDYLSGAKAITREGVNAKTRYLAQQAVNSVQPLVDDAVSAGGPNAIDSLKEGRALTKAKYATQDTIDNLPTEPVKIYQKLAAPNDTNISLLRDVKAKAPASIPAVARATVEGLLEDGKTGGAQKALNEWNKIGASTKAELFPDPSHVQALDRYFKTANEVAGLDSPPGMESPTGKTSSEPVEIYRKLTRDKDAAISALREAANTAPDAIASAARAKLQELVNGATASDGTRPGPDAAFSAWNKLGPSTKELLFPDPKIRTEIDNFMSLSKKSANAMAQNSSKTAYVNNATHFMHALAGAATGILTGNPMEALSGTAGSMGIIPFSNRIMAKIITSPGGARLLTEGMKINGNGAIATAQRAAIANRVLAIAGPISKSDSEVLATPIASGHKIGDTVNLKNVGQVTIKTINPDGTFDYESN